MKYRLVKFPPDPSTGGKRYQVLDVVTGKPLGRIAETPPLFGRNARWTARVTGEATPRATLPLRTRREAATYLWLEHLFTLSPTTTGDAS